MTPPPAPRDRPDDDRTGDDWLASVPTLANFAEAADPARYAPLPDDWVIGVSDVVNSTTAIAEGRYKAVNVAGAATISAVGNALGGPLQLFAFAGDGAHFAIPARHRATAELALARISDWVGRTLHLDLRVGTVPVADIRAAGLDARVALWAASPDVRYAMFSGGGLEWAEAQLKHGTVAVSAAADGTDPDLSGLSCQWGAIRPKQGAILSLIVKKPPDASQDRFAAVTDAVLAELEGEGRPNPVPQQGPDVQWPKGSIYLQSHVSYGHQPHWLRVTKVFLFQAMAWLVFKLGLRIGRFDATRYRREIAANTDFRKFDEGLLMTVDCTPETVERLRAILDAAEAEGAVRYGMHVQDEALMTCLVPSLVDSHHMHFVDGAGGGYAAAAQRLREQPNIA